MNVRFGTVKVQLRTVSFAKIMLDSTRNKLNFLYWLKIILESEI